MILITVFIMLVPAMALASEQSIQGVQEPKAEPTDQPEELQETQSIETTESLVRRTADAMDIPSVNGTFVARYETGQTIQVYKTDVGDGWVAVLHNEDICYLPAEVVVAATPYSHTYMSDLTQITGYTGQELEKVLADTGLAGLGEYYSLKERTHGVNALFLISIAMLESASGNSSLARNSNNLGGLKSGRSGYLSFATKEECIEYMTTLLKEDYLTEGGRFYKGITTKDVSIRYCENSASWYTQVESLMEKAFQKLSA